MRRPTLLIAALLLVAACAAEDPVAQTAVPAPTTTADQTAPTPATTGAEIGHEEDHDAATVHDEDHADDADTATHDEPADHDDDAMAEGRVSEVTMSEFSFEPSSIEISAGETVTFMVENSGLIEHEFRLSNGHRIDEHIASGHADHDDSGEGHHEADGDVIMLVAAGETEHLTFQFPEDTTLYNHVACLIPGHYEAGMVADLTTTG